MKLVEVEVTPPPEAVKPKHAPDISYIVSAFCRPLMLPVCLWSIAGQTHQEFECIVADNAVEPGVIAAHKLAVQQIQDFDPRFKDRFRYIDTTKKTSVSECYWTAQWVAENEARGTWLCFPCDDVYLVPYFGTYMLETAYRDRLDLVLSEGVVVGPDVWPPNRYNVLKQSIGRSIKSGFIVRASVFPGFACVADAKGNAMPIGSDLHLTRVMSWAGRRIGTASGVMVVHN